MAPTVATEPKPTIRTNRAVGFEADEGGDTACLDDGEFSVFSRRTDIVIRKDLQGEKGFIERLTTSDLSTRMVNACFVWKAFFEPWSRRKS